FQTREGEQKRDYVFITSGYNKGCALLKIIPDGKGGCDAKPVFVSNQFCSHFSSPVRHGDHVYGFNEDKLTCLDLRTGQNRWRQRGFFKGSLARVNASLLVRGEDGRLALGETAPAVYRHKATCQPLDGKCWTMPVVADGKLYLRNEEKIV